MRVHHNLLESYEHFHHHVLKQDRETGHNAPCLGLHSPVLSLVELLNVCVRMGVTDVVRVRACV